MSHCRPGTTPRDELARLLAQKIACAQRSWPSIRIDSVDFAIDMAERLRDDEDPLVGLSQLRESDLYLSCAAARRAPGALEAFELTLLSRVATFIGRIDATPAFIDEVKQALRIKLFVGPSGGGAKINQYSGRGPLESWICAAAIRTAYDLRRSELRRQVGDADVGLLVAGMDLELEVLRSRYESDFRAALQASVSELSARQRTLLRLYFLERLTTAQIGRLYRVHETTALRWIAQARQVVVEGARAALKARLQVSKTEFDELAGLLQSRLDVSFSRILQSQMHPNP
jgi:RNA polymerase sigma-70 factor (ECF subfamily)